MSIVTPHPRRRAARALRFASAMLAAASLVALVTLTLGSPQAHADADTSLTVSWLHDNSSAAALQPARDDSSGKLSDFSKLQVKVSQTQQLIDQAVTITVSGMAATAGLGRGAENYLQVMQCWGDPTSVADEKAADCQFGAWGNTGFDSGAAAQALAREGAGFNTTIRPDDVPFDSADGTSSTPSGTLDGLEKYFTTSTDNEQDLVPIFSNTEDNSTSFSFHVQSGVTAPQLGCGNTTLTTTADGTKCWIAIVPRGIYSGVEKGKAAGSCDDSDNNGETDYNTVEPLQVGSPLSTSCSFWNDRIVVPISFAPIALSCPLSAASLNVSGSMLMSSAMGSWQNSICNTQGGSVVNYLASDGPQSRNNLLTGSTQLAFTGEPVTTDDEGTSAGGALAAADIRYAPVANAALSIGFLVEQQSQPTQINLTPRLVAKMLTQSYREEVPTASSDYPVDYMAANPLCIVNDPEFIAINQSDINELNPLCQQESASLITTGPSGDDAIQLLWQWIQSDSAAVTWLQGTPDENGMVVNPYYLPQTNAKAKNNGLGSTDLSVGPVNAFSRSDQTSVPSSNPTLQLDSNSWNPESNTFGDVATRVLNGDSQQSTSDVDLTSAEPALTKAVPELPLPGKGLMGVTDQADVDQFGIQAAALQVPNQPGVFVAPTDDSMQAAVDAEIQPDETHPADGMATVDFSKLPTNAYPLTTTVYAAMNLNDTTLDPQTRVQWATVLAYMASQGQVPGNARGELPPGYTALDAAQQKQAGQLASILLGTLDPNTVLNQSADGDGGGNGSGNGDDASDSGSGGVPQSDTAFGDSGAVDGTAPSGSGVPVTALSGNGGVDNVTAAAAALKQPTSKTLVGRVALGGSLGVGVAGMFASPLLMRRKVIRP